MTEEERRRRAIEALAASRGMSVQLARSPQELADAKQLHNQNFTNSMDRLRSQGRIPTSEQYGINYQTGKIVKPVAPKPQATPLLNTLGNFLKNTGKEAIVAPWREAQELTESVLIGLPGVGDKQLESAKKNSDQDVKNLELFNSLYRQGKISREKYQQATQAISEDIKSSQATVKNVADASNPVNIVARGGLNLLNVATAGKAATILKSPAKNAVATGVGIGTGYGLLSPLAQGERDVSDLATSGLLGGGLGGALGFAGHKLADMARRSKASKGVQEVVDEADPNKDIFPDADVSRAIAGSSEAAKIKQELQKSIPGIQENKADEYAEFLSKQEDENIVKTTIDYARKEADAPVRTPDVVEAPVPTTRVDDNVSVAPVTRPDPQTGEPRPSTLDDLMTEITEIATKNPETRTPEEITRLDEAVRGAQRLQQEQTQVTNAVDAATPEGQVQTPQTVAQNAVQEVPVNSNASQGAPSPDIAQADYTPEEVNTALTKTAEDAKTSLQKTPIWRKAEDIFNPVARLSRSDQQAEKKLGRTLYANERAEHLADVVQNSRTQADEINNTNGLNEIITKYGGDGAEGQEFNNYLNARFAVEAAEKRGLQLINDEEGKKIGTESLRRFVDDYEARNPDAVADAQQVKAAFDDYLDRAVEARVIAPEDADFIKNYYSTYVPLQRVLPENLERATINAAPIGTLGQQKIIQSLEGSGLPLENSFGRFLDRSASIQKQINRNNLFNLMYKRVDDGIEDGTVLQTADQVLRRQAIKEDLEDIQATVASLGTQLRSATNKKAPNTQVIENRIVDRVQRILGSAKNDTQNVFNDVVDRDPRYAAERARIEAQTFPNLTKQEARDQIKYDLGQLDKQYPQPQKLSRQDLLELGEVIARNDTQSAKLFDKIAASNKYSADTKERIQIIRDEIQGLKGAKQELRQESMSLQPGSTTGKQVISGQDGGVQVKIEVEPHMGRILGGLDQKDINAFLKVVGSAQKPFRAFWTGVFNPLFSVTSAAIFDPVAGFIVSKNGTETLVSPKAWSEFFKSFNANSEFQKQLREGGAQITRGSQIAEDTSRSVELIAARRDVESMARYAVNPKNVGTLVEKLDIIGGKLANASRTRIAQAERSAARRAGATEDQALAEAVYAYNNVLPNYRRMSDAVRSVDAVIPYTGATVAGIRSVGTAARRRPVATAFKTGVALSPGVIGTMYSLSQDQGQEFYQDMQDSNKEYILDNYWIFVSPTARKDEKTGQWHGIVKVPVPPELRGLNKAVWRQTYEGVTGQNVASPTTYARAAFDTMSGQIYNSDNPVANLAVQQVTGVNPQTGEPVVSEDLKDLPKDQQVYDTTSGAARLISKGINAVVPENFETSPIMVDAGLKQFGSSGRFVQSAAEKGLAKAGVIPKEQITESGVMKEIKDKFTKVYGDSEGKNLFQEVDSAAQGITNPKAKADFLSDWKKDKDKTYQDSSIRASKLVASMAGDRQYYDATKKMDAYNRSKGKPGHPMFDLPWEQQVQLATMKQLNSVDKYGQGSSADAMAKKIRESGNDWLETYYKKEKTYYDAVKKSMKPEDQARWGIDPNGKERVTASPDVEKTQKEYFGIKDSTQKAAYLADHPELTNYWSEKAAYEAQVRKDMNLPAYDAYPQPSKEVKALQDQFFKLPKGEGKKGGSPARRAFLEAHPELTAHWDKSSKYDLAKKGALVQFEGIEWDDDDVKDMGTISRNAAAAADKATGRGGGGGGGKRVRKTDMDMDGMKDPAWAREYLNALLPAIEAARKAPDIRTKPNKPKLKIKVPARAAQPKRVTIKL